VTFFAYYTHLEVDEQNEAIKYDRRINPSTLLLVMVVE
jgi:hypothetical protein